MPQAFSGGRGDGNLCLLISNLNTIDSNLVLFSDSDLILESLQNVRKHRTIQADKLRSVESAYLVNYIVDFRHNQRKYRQQLQLLEKDFGHVERDNLWRAKCSLPKL